MASYILTPARAVEYAKRFDLRSAIVKAARQILSGYGIEAAMPGDGTRRIPRSYTSIDFQKGAATGRRIPVILGDRRYDEYAEWLGTLSILNTVSVETSERDPEAALTEDHLRELDRLCSLEDAIFMEHVEPFTAQLLPLHDVLQIVPIEPDERPENEREVNAAFRRWRLKVAVRYNQWPAD